MPLIVGGAPLEHEPVGAVLARMRRARKLTGAELAEMVGMSQPKISRIERGRGLADPADIAVIARALGADETLVQSLTDRAEEPHDRMTDWRPTAASLANRQDNVAQWEAAVQTVRDFQPALVPGLLQAGEYARAAMNAFQRLVRTASGDGVEKAVLSAVTARTRRQEILADPSRSFRFVITEAVLRNRICPPAGMLVQIERLREISARPNVNLGVIPDGAPVGIPMLHGFTLLDDTMVIIDVYNTGLTSRGRNDVDRYRQVFDIFQDSATDEIGPLLNKYHAHYVEQLRAPAPAPHRSAGDAEDPPPEGAG